MFLDVEFQSRKVAEGFPADVTSQLCLQQILQLFLLPRGDGAFHQKLLLHILKVSEEASRERVPVLFVFHANRVEVLRDEMRV